MDLLLLLSVAVPSLAMAVDNCTVVLCSVFCYHHSMCVGDEAETYVLLVERVNSSVSNVLALQH